METMKTKRKKIDLSDHDNPEWMVADFKRAQGPESLSDIERAAFLVFGNHSKDILDAIRIDSVAKAPATKPVAKAS